ncbi:MAG: ABC transporter permease, partial [Lachnospiraceae bacterium]|nr:ABC transporter permease [Lachnospiraceae bacterium]
MAGYILKRIAAGILSLFALITITFFLMHSIPGGPFSKGENRKVPDAVLEQIRDQYGLNDPVPVQYVKY